MDTRKGAKNNLSAKDRLLFSMTIDVHMGALMFMALMYSGLQLLGSYVGDDGVMETTENFAMAHVGIALCAVLASYVNHIGKIKLAAAKLAQISLVLGVAATLFLLFEYFWGITGACLATPVIAFVYSEFRTRTITKLIDQLDEAEFIELNRT